MFRRKKLLLPLLLCATLGLAPFFPEPHLWGKIKWILGGGGWYDRKRLARCCHPWVSTYIADIYGFKKAIELS